VTLYLYDHPELGERFYHYNTQHPELSGRKIAIDTAEDFARANDILIRLGEKSTHYELGDLAKILKTL
jgi:spore coat polysaccharide biosynthesis protein SpsF (cytidylyltransferase family)